MSMPQLQNLGLSRCRLGRRRHRRLRRRRERGAAYALDGVRGLPALLPQPLDLGTRPQEPWAFGEPYESVCREMLKLRQRLIPYLYSLFDECHSTGAPILRPSYSITPTTRLPTRADDEFLLGDALLVAPITRPGVEHRHVYLPEAPGFTTIAASGSTARPTYWPTRPSASRPSTSRRTRRYRWGLTHPTRTSGRRTR